MFIMHTQIYARDVSMCTIAKQPSLTVYKLHIFFIFQYMRRMKTINFK